MVNAPTNLVPAVRKEWTRSYARRERWKEEVVICEEEVERTQRSIQRECDEWRERATAAGQGHNIERIALGKQSYALRQVLIREELLSSFKTRRETMEKGLSVLGQKRKRAIIVENTS